MKRAAKTKREARVSGVKAGEKVYTQISQEKVVLENCGDREGGLFYCVTHQALFPNLNAKELHLDNAQRHRLAWVCCKHGLETP